MWLKIGLGYKNIFTLDLFSDIKIGVTEPILNIDGKLHSAPKNQLEGKTKRRFYII